jgi:ER lumen protein retaining receptor
MGHTVFALSFARIFELIFWLGSFKELSDHNNGRAPGYLVLFSQFIHLVIMADFFYYYFKSISKGLPMELPTTYSGVV